MLALLAHRTLLAVALSVATAIVACGSSGTNGGSGGGSGADRGSAGDGASGSGGSGGGVSGSGGTSGGASGGGDASGGGGNSGGVGGSGGAPVSSDPIPEAEFADRYAEAICGNISACCGSAGYTFIEATCLAWYQQSFERVAAAQVVYDEVQAGLCVAFAAQVARDCLTPATSGPCELVYQGTVAQDELCDTSADCARPAGGTAICTSGTCEQNPRQSAGGLCGQTCVDDGVRIECQDSLGGASGSCWVNDGLQCLNGTCVPLGEIGDDCSTLGCVDGAYCEWGTRKCAPKIPIGGACPQPSVDPLHACVDEAYCKEPEDQCMAKLPDGSPCEQLGSEVGFECASGHCDRGTCAPPRPVSDNACGG